MCIWCELFSKCGYDVTQYDKAGECDGDCDRCPDLTILDFKPDECEKDDCPYEDH